MHVKCPLSHFPIHVSIRLYIMNNNAFDSSTYYIITVYTGTSNKKLAITGTHQTATFIFITMN